MPRPQNAAAQRANGSPVPSEEAAHADGLPASLRAFLHGIVDYAGLFPPAGLPLREALQNYARYRQEDHAWMLGCFVIPVRRLTDLDEYARLFSEDARMARGEAPPYAFSVLGTGGDTAEDFLQHFAEDLALIDAFADRREGRATADAMEVRLPAALLEADTEAMEDFFSAVHREIILAGTAQLDLHYEIPLADDGALAVPVAAEALAAHNASQEHPLRAEAGLKFRCGGEAASDFPDPAALARAISACQRADVRFKATAGLHHPTRHRDDDLGVWRHGFLNVFAAAALAEAQEMDADVLRRVLLEEDADRFDFRPDMLVWEGYAAPTDAIERAREHLAASFGSCSFEEPVEDLHDIGLF